MSVEFQGEIVEQGASLFAGMLEVDPASRLTAAEVAVHPFFRLFNQD